MDGVITDGDRAAAAASVAREQFTPVEKLEGQLVAHVSRWLDSQDGSEVPF